MSNVYRLNWINTEARLERERAQREAAQVRFEQSQARAKRINRLLLPINAARLAGRVVFAIGRVAFDAWRARG